MLKYNRKKYPMKKAFLLLFLIFVLAGCGKKNTVNTTSNQSTPQPKSYPEVKIVRPTFNTIDVASAKEMLDSDKKMIVIDISPQYGQGHLPRAVNYNMGNGTLEKAMANLKKNDTYLVYGRNANFSIASAQKLANDGFKNVYRLDGDYDKWVEAGYEVEK